MKVIADTNVLVRLFTDDDPAQSKAAAEALGAAEAVFVSLQVFCELVWVLDRAYKVAKADIAATIRALLETRGVVANRAAVEVGLAFLEGGGDFADGVIAHDGRFMGGEVFVSFDRRAVKLAQQAGAEARLLD
ncbi:type II toxin-antitoxin system VapC family toxin [Oryzibacter oryziterrae]|uniref:type II toxin-antitoxin system VapC family toxin n=1 Tax=Oryzibacter oryziterrae TaxID=2766474 RepID=UPI001F239E99|nr:type II toxin-antitoxin system VapC family toxin [Oryzibacter oryziterrae]